MPFFETALINKEGASGSGSPEDVTHYGGVRFLLVGTGNLDLQLISLGEIYTSDLVPLVMASATNIEPTRLCNFVQQKAKLKVSTDGIDEFFEINKLIFYVKEIYKSLPM